MSSFPRAPLAPGGQKLLIVLAGLLGALAMTGAMGSATWWTSEGEPSPGVGVTAASCSSASGPGDQRSGRAGTALAAPCFPADVSTLAGHRVGP